MRKRKILSEKTNINYLAPEKTGYYSNVIKTIIRRFPQKGKIWVKEGDYTEPSAIVGIAQTSPGFRVFNLAEILDVAPQKVPNCLLKSSGSKVFKGDVIAEDKKTFGFISRQFISPVDGIFEYVDQKRGQAMIQFMPVPMKLVAGVYGEIIKVVPDQEVHIRTRVDLITAALGSGFEREGVMRVIGAGKESIALNSLDRSYTGSVLAGGALMNKEIIQKALALEIRGLVSGGINIRDYRSLVSSLNPLEDVGISLLATEGYGFSAMPQSIIEVLNKYNNRFVIINPKDKELIIPSLQPSKQKNIQKRIILTRLHQIKEGVTVRLLTSPYLGKEGIVTEVKKEAVIYASGMQAYSCVVEISADIKMLIPIRNLELVIH